MIIKSLAVFGSRMGKEELFTEQAKAGRMDSIKKNETGVW